MLRMESHHSETSLNISERESAAWVKLWNVNYNSTGSDTDLTSAIGDKEVAAKAVAFVVNSTRKGIVPLCADVANLLRANKSLEERVLHLTKENEALRLESGERASLTGDTITSSRQSGHTGCAYPPDELRRRDSACSLHSASASSRTTGSHDGRCSKPAAARADQPESCLNGIGNASTLGQVGAPGVPVHSFVPVTPATKSSPRTDNEVIVHPIPSEELPSRADSVTQAEVHVSPQPTTTQGAADWSRRDLRTPSLSSSEHGSSRSLELHSVEERRSTSRLSKQFSKSILVNNKLAEELNAARATIEKLQREVRDFRVFCKNNNHEAGDVGSGNAAERHHSACDVSQMHRLTPERSDLITPAALLSSCQICADVRRASNLNGAIPTSQFKHDAATLFARENMLVNTNDSVLTASNQCGTVRFIGHLEGFAPTCLFVGLELADKVAGGLDGSYNGKKYFTCPKGRGMFIQAQDIANIITKKQASVFHKSKKPASGSSHIEDSLGSSSNSGGTGFVSKIRKATINIRHTPSQKRISLPSSVDMPRQSTPETTPSGATSNAHHRTRREESRLAEGFV